MSPGRRRVGPCTWHIRKRRTRPLPHGGLNEGDVVLMSPERLEDAVDAVSRKAEDGVDAPCDEALDEQIRRGGSHAFRRCKDGSSTLKMPVPQATSEATACSRSCSRK